MALVQKRTKNNRRLLILVSLLIVFGLLTLILLWGTLFPTRPAPDNNLSNTPVTPGVRDLPVYTELGTEVLSDPRLDQLEVHGTFPIRVGTPGRNNPFVEPVVVPPANP